jgi:hypothetical protein
MPVAFDQVPPNRGTPSEGGSVLFPLLKALPRGNHLEICGYSAAFAGAVAGALTPPLANIASISAAP